MRIVDNTVIFIRDKQVLDHEGEVIEDYSEGEVIRFDNRLDADGNPDPERNAASAKHFCLHGYALPATEVERKDAKSAAKCSSEDEDAEGVPVEVPKPQPKPKVSKKKVTRR